MYGPNLPEGKRRRTQEEKDDRWGEILFAPDVKVFDQVKYFSSLFLGSYIYISRVCVQESLSENQRGHL